MTEASVTIQITPTSLPSIPTFMGEVTTFAQVLTHTGVLKTIQEQVRFARARFDTYDLIDFVAVLIGYAVSGEPTLKAFYERLAPFAESFMALFGRNQLPHRSTLSRFLAALDQASVEALRTLFQRDLLARKPFASPRGLFDRTEGQWIVMDVDGTRQAARQRALPQTEDLPAPHRRFDQVCAPGYQGRKRGEVVRTRTVVLQAHTHQFLGTFGGSGNGDYRSELRRAIQVITTYATHLRLPTASILVRLDGLYGDAAPLLDVLSADLGVIARSRAYHLLDLEMVKQTLARTPVHVSAHPESGMTRALYDCPAVPLTPTGKEVRLVVATHPVTTSSSPVDVERDGTVYELFVSTLPSPAFTASDVLDLYLHRGSFETVLADEDVEQNADRWYSHTPCGQEFSQILAQWAWNWGNSFLQQSCARPNLLQPLRRNLLRKKSLHRQIRLRRRSSMALPNGLALRLQEAFPVLRFPRSLMAHCAALPTTRCILKNDAQSVMAPCGSCMRHASAIAVPVLCGHSVKRAAPRSNHAG